MIIRAMWRVGLVIVCAIGNQVQAADQKVTELSYVYYPSGNEVTGCARFVDPRGTLYNLIGRAPFAAKPLASAIATASAGGHSFARFVFKATEEQCKVVDAYLANPTWSLSCSRASLRPLRLAGICRVPWAIDVSPMLTSAYLTAGHKLGLNNVQRIEWHGGADSTFDVSRIGSAAAGESVIILAASCMIYMATLHRLLMIMAG